MDFGKMNYDKKSVFEDIQKYILEEEKILLILVYNDKIIGFIAGHFTKTKIQKIKNLGSIDDMYILPEMREMGFSSKLKDGFIAWFKEKKVGRGAITLYVLPRNKPAQKAYNKWGFKTAYLKLVKELK